MNAVIAPAHIFAHVVLIDPSIFEIYFLSYRLALQTGNDFVAAANNQHFSVAVEAKQRNIYA